MELSGKVINILPEQKGEGQKGTWRKQEYIVETQEQYPKKVCVAVWGDKIDQYNLQEGDVVNAQVNVESREFNGRWYTDVKAWRIDKQADSNAGGPSDFIPQHDNVMPPSPPLPEEEDDLPF